MFIQSLRDVEKTGYFVKWGNGTSHRLLTKGDNMGFTVCHTVVWAGTESRLKYKNHLEACYCIAGMGEIEDISGNKFPIQVGDLYALNNHDEHILRAGTDIDLVLVSIFNPALQGKEVHDIGSESSEY